MILYHIEIDLPTTFFIPTIFGKNVAFIKTLVRLMVEFCRFWLHNWLLTIHLSVWNSIKTKTTIQIFTEKFSFRSHKKLRNQSKLQKRLCNLGYCPMQSISSQCENQENIVVKCLRQRFSVLYVLLECFLSLVLRNSVFKHQNTRCVLYYWIFACFSLYITLIVYLSATIKTLIVYYFQKQTK